MSKPITPKSLTPIVGNEYKILNDGWGWVKGSTVKVIRIDRDQIWMRSTEKDPEITAEMWTGPRMFTVENLEEIPAVTQKEIDAAKKGLAKLLGIK